MLTLMRWPLLQALHLKQPSSPRRPLQTRLESLHIQLNPLVQPLHPKRHNHSTWLAEEDFVARLTLPMDRKHPLWCHLWHIQRVAFGSSYTWIHEPTPREYLDAFPGFPGAAPSPTMPAYIMPEHGLGFTSLRDLCGQGCCGGRSRASRKFSKWSLTNSKNEKVLRGVTEDLS